MLYDFWWLSKLMPTESWKLLHLQNRKPVLSSSFSYLVSCRARLYLCELRIFLRCSCCSLRWLLLEYLPAQLGFSLITPTLVCFCFGSDSWWCVLFEGRTTVAVSAESIVSCFSLFAGCPMLFRWTNWRSILCYKWVVVKFNSDPLLNVAGALLRRLVLILIFCFVWTLLW